MYRRIGVLCGGLSSEREVSLKTGSAVKSALDKLGYDSVLVDVDRDIDKKLRELSPDYCFIALHGKYGEDGTIQGLLEILGIPYNGANVAASSIAYDKHLTKVLLQSIGITTPEFYLCNSKDDVRFLPVVVKPAREGSTIGVSVVKSKSDFAMAYEEAKKFDDKVLVERFIEGKELTVGIVNGEVLPAIYIKPKKGFYDFESKYTKGTTEYIFETGLSEEETEKLNETSLKIAKIIGCESLCRIDFIYDGKDFYLLEVNTIPGLTETSLLPKAALKAGYSFEMLIDKIIKGD
ncbi:D-alanine--D-alanine ligase [Deferribacter thermophilus]|uniref:D-alanine--D-alanine ligase n=1 Tax=Deferribacter thermophilus TaxID=53573 RepID=UPI003C1DF2B0